MPYYHLDPDVTQVIARSRIRTAARDAAKSMPCLDDMELDSFIQEVVSIAEDYNAKTGCFQR